MVLTEVVLTKVNPTFSGVDGSKPHVLDRRLALWFRVEMVVLVDHMTSVYLELARTHTENGIHARMHAARAPGCGRTNHAVRCR